MKAKETKAEEQTSPPVALLEVSKVFIQEEVLFLELSDDKGGNVVGVKAEGGGGGGHRVEEEREEEEEANCHLRSMDNPEFSLIWQIIGTRLTKSGVCGQRQTKTPFCVLFLLLLFRHTGEGALTCGGPAASQPASQPAGLQTSSFLPASSFPS